MQAATLCLGVERSNIVGVEMKSGERRKEVSKTMTTCKLNLCPKQHHQLSWDKRNLQIISKQCLPNIHPGLWESPYLTKNKPQDTKCNIHYPKRKTKTTDHTKCKEHQKESKTQ